MTKPKPKKSDEELKNLIKSINQEIELNELEISGLRKESTSLFKKLQKQLRFLLQQISQNNRKSTTKNSSFENGEIISQIQKSLKKFNFFAAVFSQLTKS